MHSGQTISLKSILWKILRNPLASELTYEEAAEHAIEAIRILGAPLSFEDKVTDPAIRVNDYKALLPPELLVIRGVRVITNLDNYDDNPIPLRYATDIYHNKTSCTTDATVTNSSEPVVTDLTIDESGGLEFTYTTQKGIIYTSIKEGHIQISYKALMVDEEGYPLISNNEKLIMALEYYILHRYLEPLWMMGKITDKAFNYIEQKRHFYMGGADTSMKLSGIDHLESIMNTVNRLLINTNAHNDSYKGSGTKERLRRY
jgi:hypothetical protein